MCGASSRLATKVAAVSKSRLSIYDNLDGNPELFFDIEELEELQSDSVKTGGSP
jgi:hypothetical protein